jgi:valyl-tRNA synthetase
MSEQMQPRYEPQGVEERWQQAWEAEGHYNADPDPARKSFAIAHPPPNVTGDLHLGHALQLSLADTIVRTRRMQGYNVLFQPGYDHAGISTQNAVEKHLATEGKTRQDLGREAFEARVWEWLHEYGGKIMVQFRRIGALPVERTVGADATMNVQLQRAVTSLNTVVVTALGETAAKRSLGTAQQSVTGAAIAETQRDDAGDGSPDNEERPPG